MRDLVVLCCEVVLGYGYLVAIAEGWPAVVTGVPTSPNVPTVESKL